MNKESYRIVPWQEEIPLTDRQKRGLITELNKAHKRGEIDLNKYIVPDARVVEDERTVGTRKWKRALDEYFSKKGTTTLDFWKENGFNPSDCCWHHFLNRKSYEWFTRQLRSLDEINTVRILDWTFFYSESILLTVDGVDLHVIWHEADKHLEAYGEVIYKDPAGNNSVCETFEETGKTLKKAIELVLVNVNK